MPAPLAVMQAASANGQTSQATLGTGLGPAQPQATLISQPSQPGFTANTPPTGVTDDPLQYTR